MCVLCSVNTAHGAIWRGLSDGYKYADGRYWDVAVVNATIPDVIITVKALILFSREYLPLSGHLHRCNIIYG